MRCTILAILALAAALAHAAPSPAESSSVPLRWTVETSRAQVAQFDAYRGETLDLEATMQSYGKPFAIAGEDVRIYWQTNGMGAAWWSAPAAVKAGRSGERDTYAASWTPSMDAGAGVYNCFIGQSGGNYRAAFTLRMRPAPGAVPNTLDLPRQTINFATVEVLNPPWITPQTVTNIVTDLGQQFGKVQSVNGQTGVVNLNAFDVGALSKNGGEVGEQGETVGALELSSTYMDAPNIELRQSFLSAGSISVPDSAIYVQTGEGPRASITKGGREVATEDQVEAVNNRVESLGTTVNAWQTYWDGDDVRLTVTNYYGSLDIPALYLEQKMPADGDHDEPWFKTVWDERTRWNAFLSDYAAVTNEVAQNKADRAWGVYDSSSGEYSPDGLLQISQEQVMIASGLAYQKTVTAGGCAVWVLKATNPTSVSGELENGYFRIQDGDGNPLFEIVKGDKRVVGAVATDVQVSGGTMTVRYNSVSDQHPVLEVCTDLSRADWQREDEATVASVAWSGSSGAWVATVTPVGARPQLFAKASYEAGGNTYIRNHVASSLDKVVVGGQEYTVTVQTINGKKLLVLE